MALTKIRKDGITIELEESQAQALTMLLEKLESQGTSAAQQVADMKAKLADATKIAADATKTAETVKGEADAAKAKVDALDAELKKATDPARIDSIVRARVAIEAKARGVLGDAVKLDGLTDRQVKTAVLEKLTPGVKFDGASDAYLDGRFDSALDFAAKGALADVRKAAEGEGAKKQDSADPEAARARMLRRLDGLEK